MNKRNYPYKKSILGWMIAFILVCAAVFSIQAVQAASGKTIKTVTVKIGSKKANGTTVSMKKGKTANIKVSISPKLTKKTVTYQSSKPSVVSVNKSGKLKANQEQQNASTRPDIEGSIEKFSDYEIIYLGFAGGIIGLN